jgi:hypothetical protein
MYGSSWKIVSSYCLNIQTAVFTDQSCANLRLNEPAIPRATVDYNAALDVKLSRAELLRLYFTFTLPRIVIDFFLNNQPDAPVIQIYSVIKLYMFRASSLPIIRSFLLYSRHG